MEEFIVSKEELHQMFEKKELMDTNDGWFYKKQEIKIIAIHKIETKYIQDMMNADFYRIQPVNTTK